MYLSIVSIEFILANKEATNYHTRYYLNKEILPTMTDTNTTNISCKTYQQAFISQ